MVGLSFFFYINKKWSTINNILKNYSKLWSRFLHFLKTHFKFFYMCVTLSSPLFCHLHPPSFCPCHCFVSVMTVAVLRGTGGISEKSEKSIQHETEGKHLMSLSNNSLLSTTNLRAGAWGVFGLLVLSWDSHTHTHTHTHTHLHSCSFLQHFQDNSMCEGDGVLSGGFSTWH